MNNMELGSDERVHAVDSCVILRFLIRDVPEQVKIVRDLFLNGHDYYVDAVAIMETVYVMTKDGWPRREIAESVLGLLRNQAFVWDRDFFEAVFKQYLERPSLSFNDIIIAKRTKARGYNYLWTFDRKFANQVPVAKLLK